MPYLNHNIPVITCYIRNEFLYNHEGGHNEFTPCDVHSVASMEKRVPLFEAFLENGVNWTRRPIHAFCWKKEAPVHPLNIHMYWDCFSPYVDVQVRNRLANLQGTLIDWLGNKHKGVYLFTLDWGWENKAGNTNTNFSETPEHKCAHVFKMDDGNFFAYPNNRIIWQDDAWVFNPIKGNPGYKIDMTPYSVENSRTKIFTDNSYITEFNDVGESSEGIK
jgi:hypothetical protein